MGLTRTALRPPCPFPPRQRARPARPRPAGQRGRQVWQQVHVWRGRRVCGGGASLTRGAHPAEQQHPQAAAVREHGQPPVRHVRRRQGRGQNLQAARVDRRLVPEPRAPAPPHPAPHGRRRRRNGRGRRGRRGRRGPARGARVCDEAQGPENGRVLPRQRQDPPRRLPATGRGEWQRAAGWQRGHGRGGVGRACVGLPAPPPLPPAVCASSGTGTHHLARPVPSASPAPAPSPLPLPSPSPAPASRRKTAPGDSRVRARLAAQRLLPPVL